MKKINAPINCRGCIHSRPLCHTGHYTYACHYLLDTGRPKECGADGCDKKQLREGAAYADRRGVPVKPPILGEQKH